MRRPTVASLRWALAKWIMPYDAVAWRVEVEGTLHAMQTRTLIQECRFTSLPTGPAIRIYPTGEAHV